MHQCTANPNNNNINNNKYNTINNNNYKYTILFLKVECFVFLNVVVCFKHESIL